MRARKRMHLYIPRLTQTVGTILITISQRTSVITICRWNIFAITQGRAVSKDKGRDGEEHGDGHKKSRVTEHVGTTSENLVFVRLRTVGREENYRTDDWGGDQSSETNKSTHTINQEVGATGYGFGIEWAGGPNLSHNINKCRPWLGPTILSSISLESAPITVR